tara:strand:+ start:11593 stop:12411 length:819 start_codon:yes stop_codon:yes gene_type:complete
MNFPKKNMIFDLQDKIILVTGGTGLLGKTYCQELAHQGAKVIMADLKQTNPKVIAAKLSQTKSLKIFGMELDLSFENEIIDLFKKINIEFGKIDVVINNAAATGEHLMREGQVFTSFEDSKLAIWEKNLKVNLTGVYLVSREAGKLMLNCGGGSIINISSTYGVVGPDHRIYKDMPFNSLASYAAAKAGVHGLTRWLATYWGEKGIRVNTIVPGGVENNHDPEFVKSYSERTPLRRMAKPKDMVGMVLYLCSDLSSYSTGQQYFVDGGWTAI